MEGTATELQRAGGHCRNLQRIVGSFPVWPQHLITPQSIPTMQQNLSISCCLFVCSSTKGLRLLLHQVAVRKPSAERPQLPPGCQSGPSAPPGPPPNAQPHQPLSTADLRAKQGWFETSASIYSPDSPPYNPANPSLGRKESRIPALHRPV